MGRSVMGYWDCPVCGNKGIAGNVMNCPSCGRARGDVKFYMKNVAENETREENERGDIEYLSDEQAAEIGKNPDWYCSFCNSLNRDNAAFCGNCGASREDSESNYFDQLKKREEAERAEKAAQPQPSQPQKKSRMPMILVIAAVLIGLLVWYMNGSNTQKGLRVTGIAWSRTIPVEENKQFTESDWSIPAGGTEVSHSQEIHHYEQVYDHTEYVDVQRSRRVIDHYETYYTYQDNGNGTFEEIAHERPVYTTEYYTETESRPVYRSEPRYATKYVYTIWRWVQTRQASASGTDHEAYWPETNLGENEREGSGRKEAYVFTVADDKGNETIWQLSEADWRKINPEDRVTISTPHSGGASHVVDEKGNPLFEITRYR